MGLPIFAITIFVSAFLLFLVQPLVGKLILPTGEKPKPEPVQPKVEKPKKLAPGEVFVDASGNVTIGE